MLFAVLVLGALYALWPKESHHLTPPSGKVLSGKSVVSGRPADHLRKEIYDRNMETLALSLRMYSVYLRPLELKRGQNTISKIISLLGLDGKRIRRQLRTERTSLWLKRNIDPDLAKKIAELHLNGIYLVSERQRLYPHGSTASQVIGFVKEEQGLAGTEFVYDNLLRGEWQLEPDKIPVPGIDRHEITEDGAAVVLSLDLKLQTLVEKKLAGLLKKSGGQSGMAVLMNADSGEVLVMANLPAYDPNLYWKYDSFSRRNRVLADPVYLGGLAEYFKAAAEINFGDIPAPSSVPGGNGTVLTPRKMKMVVSGNAQLNRSVWQKVQEGVYQSPYLADFLPSLSNEQEKQFSKEIGLLKSKKSTIPIGLEHDDEKAVEPFNLKPHAQTTLIKLTTAFARMVNGGREITPHLLHGLWMGPDKGELVAHFTSSGIKGVLPNGEFLKFLKAQFQVGNAVPPVLESLVRLPDNSSADIEFAASTEASANKALVGPPPAKRFEALALGINYCGTVPVVLAMSMDGVKDLPGKSLFSDAFKAIFRQQGLSVTKARKGARKQPRKLEDFYTKWLKIHVKKKTSRQVPETANAPDLMPNVLGFSLRKALQRLSGHDLKLQVIGAGHVINQVPKAGVELKYGQNCLLELNFSAVSKPITGEKKRGKELHDSATH